MADVYQPTDAKRSTKLLYAILSSIFLGLFFGAFGYYLSREIIPSLLIALVTIVVLTPIMIFVFKGMKSASKIGDIQQYNPILELENGAMSVFTPLKYTVPFCAFFLALVLLAEQLIVLAIVSFLIVIIPFLIRKKLIFTGDGVIMNLSIFGFSLTSGSFLKRWSEFSYYIQSRDIFKLYGENYRQEFRAHDKADRVAQILGSHIQKKDASPPWKRSTKLFYGLLVPLSMGLLIGGFFYYMSRHVILSLFISLLFTALLTLMMLLVMREYS